MLHLIGNLQSYQQCLSVPFSSGQGMLLQIQISHDYFLTTFSPLFIGARNVTHHDHEINLMAGIDFQSPFHRGKECYRSKATAIFGETWANAGSGLSVPFSSGQGMLRNKVDMDKALGNFLSVPFSSGQGMLLQ